MRISLNWIQDFVKVSPPFERLAERLTLAGLHVEKTVLFRDQKDLIFEIEVTTNRPDWLSHLGVAREIAAVENLSLHLPEKEKAVSRPMPPGWKIQLKEMEGCPYYTGILMEGIQIGQTPDFIKDRLEACGLRSIHLIVDITNYVLLETGQPLHAFDADLLVGGEIQIRRAKAQEKMTLIDGRDLPLSADDLVIGDSQRAIALAGVMGGKDTEISPKTRHIFLESAYFSPRWVRQSSKRHGLHSESSYRFERRVDPEGVDLGRERALWLIQKYARPRFVSGLLKAGDPPVTFRGTLHLSADLIQKILGVEIKPHHISSILTRLGLNVTKASDKSWNIRIPSYRSDLTRPIDLVEEIARIHGYDQMPETLPEREPLASADDPLLELEDKARFFFSGTGLHETVTFSMIRDAGLDEERDLSEAVSIVNPQNKELVWMRPVLLPSLLDVIQHNLRVGERDIFLFEIANCYRKPQKEKHAEEEKSLGIALCGPWKSPSWLDKARESTFYDLKGILESFFIKCGIENYQFKGEPHSFLSPHASECILIKNQPVGILGEVASALMKHWDLESPVYFGQLSLPKLLPHVRALRPLRELPRFPAVERDIALIVPDSVKAAAIKDEIRSLGMGLVRDILIFDFYRGGRIPKGCKNLGLRIVYQSYERTLVSEDIQALHAGVADALAKKFQAAFQ